MTKHYFKAALILTMPLLLSGCMTGYTVMEATHPDPIHKDDKVKRVEKVVQTQDRKLIALFDGRMAGASKNGPFTVTVTLTDSDFASVPRNAIIEGWHLPEDTNLLPVSVVFPIVLPNHQDSFNERDKFPGLPGAERTLYVVWNEKHDMNVQLVYVVTDAYPNKRFFPLRDTEEEREHNYPLLLLLPLSVAGDAATLPFQAIGWLISPRH